MQLVHDYCIDMIGSEFVVVEGDCGNWADYLAYLLNCGNDCCSVACFQCFDFGGCYYSFESLQTFVVVVVACY